MRYEVRHVTVYEYDHEVSLSHHVLRLTPRDLPGQRCVVHRLEIDPEGAAPASRRDHFGNTVAFLTLETPHRRLEIHAYSQLEVTRVEKVEPEDTSDWETVRNLLVDPSGSVVAGHPGLVDVCEFIFPSPLLPPLPGLEEFARVSFPPGRTVLKGAMDLCRRIHREFKFDPSATTVATTLAEFFRLRRGVCQDFAHLMVASLRSLGLPARYVSGYLETLPPPGQVKLVGADASHAWVAVWCGDAGWQDLDPTNDLRPAERHVTLGWGRDFADVSPVHGVVIGSGSHRLSVAVDVNSVPAETTKAPPGDGSPRQSQSQG